MLILPNSWQQLRKDMDSCEQTPGQSISEHCNSVYNYYSCIDEILGIGSDSEKALLLINSKKFPIKYPDWFFEYEEGLAWNRHGSSISYLYTNFHDCGKPYCKIYDADGKYHFIDHANISYNVWTHLNEISPIQPEYHRKDKLQIIGQLIKRDMEIHTIKAEDISKFCNYAKEHIDIYNSVTLLLVGLAEVSANANLFGGMESESFKTKWKQIDRRGRAICKYLKLNSDELCLR